MRGWMTWVRECRSSGTSKIIVRFRTDREWGPSGKKNDQEEDMNS